MMKRTMMSLALAIAVTLTAVTANGEETFTKEQIAVGAELYATNCSPCHGAHMRDPDAAFNLHKFPRDQHDRFINSVTLGKNQMPPWGDLFKPEQLEALWAYVMAGES